MRYVKQRDSYSCGPIALLNILKWSGLRKTYKDLPILQKECKCNNGTWPEDLQKAVKKYSNLKSFSRRKPSILKIDQHLKRHGAVILVCYWSDEWDEEIEGHFITIVGCKDKEYVCLNSHITKTAISYISREELKNMIKSTVKLTYSPHSTITYISRRDI